MLSKMTQNLLRKYSTDVKVLDPAGPVFHLDHRSEKTGGIKPDVETGLRKAKNQIGGIKVHTFLNEGVEELNRWIAELEEAGTQDERDHNLVELCNKFLDFLRGEGVDVDGFDPSITSAGFQLVLDYSHDMKYFASHIADGRQLAIDKLQGAVAFYRQVDFSDKTARDVMKLALKHNVVTPVFLDTLARYLSQQEESQHYYEARARELRVDAGAFSAAADFAVHYLTNFARNVEEQKQLVNKQHQAYLRLFKQQLRRNGEPDRNPREDEIEAFWAGLKPEPYRNFATLVSLHYEGFRELITWERDGTFVAQHRQGCAAVVMMAGDVSGLSEADIPDTLTFDGFECELQGRTFSVTDQFRFADLTPTHFGASDYAALAAVDPEKAERMKALKFRKNVWVGGVQSGQVEYVRVYKNGIKVWLTDFGK